MEKFVDKLTELLSEDNLYSCFAIHTGKEIGMKINLSKEQLKSFTHETLTYLCETSYSKMNLGAYPTASPKDFIETISVKDERIKKKIVALTQIPVHPELNVQEFNQYNTNMIIVENPKGERAYFFNRGNPFIESYRKKGFLYVFFSNEDYRQVTENVVRLVKHFDCVILEDTCYIVTTNGRKMIGLSKATELKSLENQKLLLKSGIIAPSDKKIFEDYMKSARHSSCLSDVNESIFRELSNITAKNQKAVSDKYRLKIAKDSAGFHISCSDKKEIERLVTTLTDKRGKNFSDETIETKSTFFISE